MPLIEFDENVYLRWEGVGAGDFKRGSRYELPANVAERCVTARDAHYVTDSGAPSPPTTSAASHPFVKAANILRQQPTADITAELQTLHGVESSPVPPHTEDPVNETTIPPAAREVTEPLSGGEGSDDPTERPADPEQGPFPCRSEGCVKGPFGTKSGRDTHERMKHDHVLEPSV